MIKSNGKIWKESIRMNRMFKIFLVLATLTAFLFAGIKTSAYSELDYSISQKDGEYILTGTGEEELGRHESVGELFSGGKIPSGAKVLLRDVDIYENLYIYTGEYIVSGTARFHDSELVIESDCRFENLNLSFTGDGGVRLKSGELNAYASSLVAEGGSVFTLDYSSLATLVLHSGELVSSSERGTVYAEHGVVKILGGRIENNGGAAIVTSTSIYIGGTPEINGESYSVETNRAVHLSADGEYFRGTIDVKYDAEFERGTATSVICSADLSQCEKIKIYDKNGILADAEFYYTADFTDERNFIAVVKPFYLDFYCGDKLFKRCEVLRGVPVTPFVPDERRGYRFNSWHKESIGGEIFDFNQVTASDMKIYADYELLPPEFSISSIDTVYSEKDIFLEFKSVYHPLASEGSFSYSWYKDDVAVSGAERLVLGGVSNAGVYKCKLSFTVNGETASVFTPLLTVSIRKCKVPVPQIKPCEYTGSTLRADIPFSSLYTSVNEGGVNVGSYPVILTLNDSENYEFEGSLASEIALDFVIKKASNKWLGEVTVRDAYESLVPRVNALSLFGLPVLLYSKEIDGDYTAELPAKAGKYYIVACVEETENYSSLKSEPLEFSVLRDYVNGLLILSPPDKTEYRAFEKVELAGISAMLSYASGRSESIGADKLNIEYAHKDSLRYGDSSVFVSYGNSRAVLDIKVRRAAYEISNISFPSGSVIFDGKYKSLSHVGELPVGEDGLPLYCKVTGGGIHVGKYQIELSFISESVNYELPAPIYAELEITPLQCTVIWDDTEFVYDGDLKAPSAYFINEKDRKIKLAVYGSTSFAGEYTAYTDKQYEDYLFLNYECRFKIKKASYDMSGAVWSASSFVYNGSEKTVTLSGLPSGVGVLGYLDNKAVNAGEYHAVPVFSYDTVNYNPPELSEFIWRIEKGEYPLSGFEFESAEYIYDGNEHFPSLKGELPTGKDGISLGYRYSRSVTHVCDGRVPVIIDFISESENYSVPKSVTVYVEIKPLGINVSWHTDEYFYKGINQSPSATSPFSEILVTSDSINAGYYTAVASCVNSDYYVINSQCDFEIKRAENAWVGNIVLPNTYDGSAPSPQISSLGGNVSFRYYSDSELKKEISAPRAAGTYYLVAFCDGGLNHLPISSAPFKFEILPLIPVSLRIEMSKTDFYAFETISSEAFKAYITYNSGSASEIDSSLISVAYQSASSLRFGDKGVTFSVSGVSTDCDVNVLRANYDMSGAVWESGLFTYDGEEKSIFLSGLPEGVTVLEYIGNGELDSGTYTVGVKLSYDTQNFNTPIIEDGILVIEKIKLTAPIIEDLIYTGELMSPEVEKSELYNISKNLYRDGGEYFLEITVKDTKNYVFAENGLTTLKIAYRILPREVKIKIHDVKLYIGDKLSEPEYTLLDEIAAADELELEFIIDGDIITCISLNKNYRVIAEEGNIVRVNSLSPRLRYLIFLLALILLTLLLVFLIIALRRDKFKRLACLGGAGGGDVLINPPFADENAGIEESCEPDFEASPEEEECTNDETLCEDIIVEAFSGEYSEEYAEKMISDSMAKTLLRTSYAIPSCGTRKRIINVDTISQSFDSGENVDINRMKSKNLIPYDTAYIKVLARGVIDKPLRIYANDFSLSAVKMIALSGGEAIRVKTVKVKMPKNPDE